MLQAALTVSLQLFIQSNHRSTLVSLEQLREGLCEAASVHIALSRHCDANGCNDRKEPDPVLLLVDASGRSVHRTPTPW